MHQAAKPYPCFDWLAVLAVVHVMRILPLQVFLNMQDRQLASRGKSSWVQDYYMPAPCDGLVVAGELPAQIHSAQCTARMFVVMFFCHCVVHTWDDGYHWITVASHHTFSLEESLSAIASVLPLPAVQRNSHLPHHCTQLSVSLSLCALSPALGCTKPQVTSDSHLWQNTPGTACVCLFAGRRWAEKALQLPLPVNTGRAAAEAADTTSATAAASVISLSREAAAAPRLPQQQLLNRWAQHTKHCVVCQKALQGIKHQAAAAQTAGRVLLAAAVGVMAGWVLPALVQLVSSSAAAGGGAASAVAGNGSLNLIAGAVIAAIMGIGTWLANAVAVAAGKQIAEFEYVEFSHAMNH